VFETRYRRLTERCLERKEPFGVVLIRQGREVGPGDLALAGVGTFAEIREARRLPDGRFELLVVGVGRFAIGEVDATSEPYLVAHATRLDEATGDEVRASRLSDRALRRLVRYLRLMQPAEGEASPPIDVRVEVDDGGDDEPTTGPDDAAPPRRREPTRELRIPDDPTTLSYLLSGIVQVDPLTRQLLLEAATTEKRLEELDRLLGRELRLLEIRLRYYVVEPRIDPVRRN
jgi:hypothetical protein